MKRANGAEIVTRAFVSASRLKIKLLCFESIQGTCVNEGCPILYHAGIIRYKELGKKGDNYGSYFFKIIGGQAFGKH